MVTRMAPAATTYGATVGLVQFKAIPSDLGKMASSLAAETILPVETHTPFTMFVLTDLVHNTGGTITTTVTVQ
jgi:hypothetical protein